MGWPTGYIGVVTSQLTMKWWANGSANRVFWSNDQSADNGLVGTMGWLKGYIGVMTSWPIGHECWAIDAADSRCSDGTSLSV